MSFNTQGFELVVDFADNAGKPVNRRTYKMVEASPAAIVAAAAGMIAIIAAASDAVITAYRIAEVIIQDSVTLPAAGVQNENQVIVSSPIVGIPNKSGTFTIPAPKITCFNATSGKGANEANFGGSSPLVDYAGMFDPDVGNQAYISDGEQIVSTQARGKRRHSKNNNG
jgi:hypothetical protein